MCAVGAIVLATCVPVVVKKVVSLDLRICITSPRPAAATPAAAALYQKKPLYAGRTNAGPPQRSETTSMLTSSPSLHNGKSRFHSIARVLSGGI